MKKGTTGVLVWIIFLIILVSNLCLVFAQESKENLPELEDYLQKEEAGVDEFMELDGASRNYVFENSESPYARNVMAEAIAIKISKEKLQQDLNSGALKLAADSWVPVILERLNKEEMTFSVPVDEQTKLRVKVDSYEDLKNAVKETAGIDLGIYLETEIESLDGFDDPSLKWAEEGNIIGDGKVWLNFDNLPRVVNTIKYENGRFILGFKTGGKLVLEAGSTDEKGEIVFFSKMKDVEGLEAHLSLKNTLGSDALGKPLGLSSFVIVRGDGEVILTEKGIKILDDGMRVGYGDFIFGRKKGEQASESSVDFLLDRMVLKGMELIKQGHFIVGSSKEDFVVHFRDLGGMVSGVRFLDRGTMTVERYVSPGTMGMGQPTGQYETIEKEYGEVRFWFNNEGKLTHIKKQGYADNEWVSVSKGGSSLRKILGASSSSVDFFVDEANKADGLSYSSFEKMFYIDSMLKKDAGIIKVDSYHDALAINGENMIVSGNGRIEVLRDLNSLTSADGRGFSVRVGEVKLNFDEKGFHYSRKPVKESFEIKSISVIKDSRFSVNEFSLAEDSSGNKMVSKSKSFVAGREVYVGPYGSSVDLHLDVSRDDYDRIRRKVQSGDSSYAKDDLISAMMDSDFKLVVDTYVPVKGISLKGENVRDVVKAKAFPELEKIFTVEGKQVKLRGDILKVIENRIMDSIGNVESFRGGRISIELKNNGRNPPSIALSFPGEAMRNIPLKGKEAEFIRDTLQASLRAPEMERGPISKYTAFRIFGLDTAEVSARSPLVEWFAGADIPANKYWPRPYLQRLWYLNFGRGADYYDDRFDRMMVPSDAEFFMTGKKSYLGKYIEKK